jgi:quinol monooxygenase YgiN
MNRMENVHVRVTTVRVRGGGWFDYEAAARRLCLESRAHAEGRRSLWLVRADGDEDIGFTVSVWDDGAALARYESSDWYKEYIAELDHYVAGEIPVTRGELRFLYETGKGWEERSSRY